MNDELLARIKHTTAAIRTGTYVSRETMQELIIDIHDDQVSTVDPAQLPLVPDRE